MQNSIRILAERKISQSELYRISGASQSHISAIIRDKKTPIIAVIKKLTVYIDSSCQQTSRGGGGKNTVKTLKSLAV